jgi:hypothetical protein
MQIRTAIWEESSVLKVATNYTTEISKIRL